MSPKKCDPLWPIPPKQDWDQMFDGSVYEVRQGEDYDCPTDTYLRIVQDKAAQRGIKARVQIIDGGFVIQAIH